MARADIFVLCLYCKRSRVRLPHKYCRRCFEAIIDSTYVSPPDESAFMQERSRRIEIMRLRAERRLPLFEPGFDVEGLSAG